MARIDDIIEDKLSLYDNADNVFLSGIESTQTAIYRRLVSILDQIPREGGKIKSDDTALQLLVQLDKEIKDILRNSTYLDKVDQFLKNFDTMQKLNTELVEEANGIKLSRVNLNPLKTQAIDTLSTQLASEPARQQGIVNPIKQVMFQSVATGMKIDEAKAVLRSFVLGTANRNGHLQRYVGQIARDALNQYDGLVNDVIRNEYELNAFRYVGSLVDDSRPQCIRWVAKEVLPFDTLQDEIDWALTPGNGQGMNPITTPENFATYRGGYNCRHMAIPIRLENQSNE